MMVVYVKPTLSSEEWQKGQWPFCSTANSKSSWWKNLLQALHREMGTSGIMVLKKLQGMALDGHC